MLTEDFKSSHIFFVRHAETYANASNIYTLETESVFTDNGRNQINILTDNLKNHNFDYIIVSPTWRTQNTILSYLVCRAGQIKGEIWPELTECCWQKDMTVPATYPDGINTPQGALINLENEFYLKYRDESSNREYEWPTKNYADGLIQAKKVVEMIKSRFGGKGLNVLVITHSVAGFHITRELSGTGYYLSNAKLTPYRENLDGSFIRVQEN